MFFYMYVPTCYVRTQIFGKREHFWVPYKRQICVRTFAYSRDIILPFSQGYIKGFCFCNNSCSNIECPNLQAKFLFQFLYTLKFVFYVFSIIGSYRPESQNAPSYNIVYVQDIFLKNYQNI
jgi:hypothetical protein